MRQFFFLSLFISVCFGFFTSVNAQEVKHEKILSFEEVKLSSDFYTSKGSALALSDQYHRDGQHSLQWKSLNGATLSIKKQIDFEPKDPTGKDTYLSTFVVWVYNDKPKDEQIRFTFYKDNKECSSFPFNINFKGWRAAWVCFERDMEGKPEVGMNELRISAPSSGGTLYFDQMILASKTDHRHQTADNQVPFVNAETDSHWLVVRNRSLLKPDITLESAVSASEQKDMEMIEKRFKELIYTPGKLTEQAMESLRAKFQSYQISVKDGIITGKPIYFARAAEAYERFLPSWNKELYTNLGLELKAYFDLMNRVAIAYNNAEDTTLKAELKSMFLLMYQYAGNQGVAYGSCLGNFTHYGYSFRGFYTSYFLMKDVLIEAGKLEEARQTMQWYAMANEVYINPTAPGMDMDSFNTMTTGRIASILIMENSPEKVQYLKSFSRWINNGCLPAIGLAGAFKKDGGAFHHRNNYPAYAVGGLEGASNMIYLLSRTSFRVSELGHSTVKNVLLTMRFYCNKTYFPLSMSGRHPDGKGTLIPNEYAMMAKAGTPDGLQPIDADMAGAYLRLVPMDDKKEKKMINFFLKKNFKAEEDPQGNIAIGYGCFAVQRRSNWSAVARGHSRYLWAAEHYLGANWYGRYLAHGSLQILTAANPQDSVTPATSGWQHDGFDWGRIPGTTAIHLPVAQLKANILNVDVYSGIEEMLYSDEAFAGGISQQQNNGAFGMKLHEHDKYNGSMRARKSYHFFDNRIVCLGTDVENVNANYDTETTVFQLAAPTDTDKKYWNNYVSKNNTWLDPMGTGYYVPQMKEQSKLKLEKHFPQMSLAQNTQKETKGDFVSLVVNHGKAPKGGNYEYVILPQTTESKLADYAKKPTYVVLQKDRNAHIVKDLPTGTTSYVLFETPRVLPKGILQKVDTACLVMLREQKKQIVLTVCNPDLNLYSGPSDELFDKDGKRVERSIYSRPWIDNVSGIIPVKVTLKGKWNLKETPDCKLISATKNETVLQFNCQDGMSFDVELSK